MKHLVLCIAVLGISTVWAEEPAKRFEAEVDIRPITSGPKAHWFGYYDKNQFDPSNRYVLGMETEFEGRTPEADEVVRLGVIDLDDGDSWRTFGETRAWSWQQGCMLQWVPGSDSEVIYNERKGDKFISVIQNVFTGEKRELSRAIYSVSPDGTWAVGLNFARVDQTRPGYGYKGGIDRFADLLAPDDEGIYRLDLKTGKSEEIVTLGQIAAIPHPFEQQGKHWFNHLLINPDSSRFIFLHRVRETLEGGPWVTRMFTANQHGKDLHVVADTRMVSHFIWHDSKHILAWAHEPELKNRFWRYRDQSDDKEVIGEGVLGRDGHCTYSPDGKWILTDEYPDKERMQALMLYRPSDGKLVRLGKFYLTRDARGEFRCDLHPRWSRDGRYVCIDSMHMGDSRQMYLLDVGDIVHGDNE